MSPLPRTFIHPDDAAAEGLVVGDWAEVVSRHGRISAMVEAATT